MDVSPAEKFDDFHHAWRFRSIECANAREDCPRLRKTGSLGMRWRVARYATLRIESGRAMQAVSIRRSHHTPEIVNDFLLSSEDEDSPAS